MGHEAIVFLGLFCPGYRASGSTGPHVALGPRRSAICGASFSAPWLRRHPRHKCSPDRSMTASRAHVHTAPSAPPLAPPCCLFALPPAAVVPPCLVRPRNIPCHPPLVPPRGGALMTHLDILCPTCTVRSQIGNTHAALPHVPVFLISCAPGGAVSGGGGVGIPAGWLWGGPAGHPGHPAT